MLSLRVQLLPQETYFPSDGARDMFYPRAWSDAAVDAHCRALFGVAPRRGWIAQQYGGLAVR
jgi:hypothetical protein